eukprot:gnl/TRDRNA2_/TRDRNA2_151678_c0_seq1.p1 gnl/TRDRNA2_/TRDRNA2_151678_c0~~gnl/TRDRNA2_/TRDRNA2_151678_c0_seq1.p1  ORF type:complete len:524 (+),score=88.38 gnl/TRDRNA2_/TRDRNA2_151678_c0_seq1:176-1747(+)
MTLWAVEAFLIAFAWPILGVALGLSVRSAANKFSWSLRLSIVVGVAFFALFMVSVHLMLSGDVGLDDLGYLGVQVNSWFAISILIGVFIMKFSRLGVRVFGLSRLVDQLLATLHRAESEEMFASSMAPGAPSAPMDHLGHFDFPIRVEQDANSQGLMLIAMRHIACGEVAWREPPLLVARASGLRDRVHAFAAADRKTREAVLMLYEEHKVEQILSTGEVVKEKVSDAQTLKLDAAAHKFASEEVFVQYFPDTSEECRQRMFAKVLRVWACNAFKYTWGIALFRTLCVAKHACRPNAMYVTTSMRADGQLVALAPIAKGQQLTITFLPNDLPARPAEHRRAWLRENIRFECKCQACMTEPINERMYDRDLEQRVLALRRSEESFATCCTVAAEAVERVGVSSWITAVACAEVLEQVMDPLRHEDCAVVATAGAALAMFRRSLAPTGGTSDWSAETCWRAALKLRNLGDVRSASLLAELLPHMLARGWPVAADLQEQLAKASLLQEFSPEMLLAALHSSCCREA